MSHILRERSVVNRSVSKQQFAFSRASRFSSPKPQTNAFGYEQHGFFGKTKPLSTAFGITQSRFGYEELKKHQRGIGVISSPESVEPLSTKQRA